MPYPDNVFDTDQLEVDQYGGADADVFDFSAWTFVTGLVRSIARAVLRHTRVPFSSAVLVVQEYVSVGDVLAIDLTLDAIDPTTQMPMPYIRRYSNLVFSGHQGSIIGVAVSAAATGGKAQVAVGGILPQSVTGLTLVTAGGMVAVDPSTSRLRAWAAGDDAIGFSSPRGAVLLTFPGRVAV